jgi:predicted ester cyclase
VTDQHIVTAISPAEMRRLYEDVWLGELWNKGDSAGGRVLAEDFADDRPINGFPNTKAGHIAMAMDWHQAFPDLVFAVQDVIISRNKLVGRYLAEGTHRGTLLGISGTGRRVSLTGIDILRFRGPLITYWWHNEDFYGLMHQITE